MYIKIRNYYDYDLKVAECATELTETAIEWAERPENISNPVFYDKKSFVYYTPEKISNIAELKAFIENELIKMFPKITWDYCIHFIEKSTRVINDTRYIYKLHFKEQTYDIFPSTVKTFPLSTAIWGAQEYRHTGDALNLPSMLENRPNPKNEFKLIEVQ